MRSVEAASSRGAKTNASPLAEFGTPIDLADRVNLPILVEMMRSISSAETVFEVQARFGSGMRQIRSFEGYISTSVRGLEGGAYKVTRQYLDGPIETADVPNPWRDWESIPLSRGGFLGAIMERGQPALLHHLNVRGDPALGDSIAAFGSAVAFPLWDGGKVLNWSFFLARSPTGFSPEILEELLVSTNFVGGTVRTVLANQKLREADEAKTFEIERIARIQRALLPNPLPTIPGAELGAHYATFGEAGGDLYAVRPVRVRGSNTTQWLMLIADASGHGPSAAVVSAMVDAIVATVPDPIDGPGPVLETLNEYLFAKRIEAGFVTAFLGLFDPASRTFRYARAGHNPPLVRGVCPVGSLRFLDQVGDIPLGIAPGLQYEEASTQFQPGETLVLYTDGIVEARAPSDEMFGVARIGKSLCTCSGAPECAVRSITTSLHEFESGVRPADDQTLLVMQVAADNASI